MGYYTVLVAKIKPFLSCAITVKLMYALVFAHAWCQSFHDMTKLVVKAFSQHLHLNIVYLFF